MTNHKQERAQRIVDATMELTLRPQQGDRAKVISAAIRETINQLTLSNGGFNWEEEQGMMFNAGYDECLKHIDAICYDLEALDELAQENPQGPLDAL